MFYITHFVEFYGLKPSTCFGFLIPLVEYFIAVFFWRSWLSGPIISSVGAFDWACSKKQNLSICIISSTCLRAYRPICVVLESQHQALFPTKIPRNCIFLLMGLQALWAHLLLSLCIRLYFMTGPIAFGLRCHEFGILANHFVLVIDPSLWAQNSLCCRLHFGPNQLHLGLAPAMNQAWVTGFTLAIGSAKMTINNMFGPNFVKSKITNMLFQTGKH